MERFTAGASTIWWYVFCRKNCGQFKTQEKFLCTLYKHSSNNNFHFQIVLLSHRWSETFPVSFFSAISNENDFIIEKSLVLLTFFSGRSFGTLVGYLVFYTAQQTLWIIKCKRLNETKYSNFVTNIFIDNIKNELATFWYIVWVCECFS